MYVKLANRGKAIKPSPTLSVSRKAKELIAKGIDVINFGVGEPDFPTPEYIKAAGIKAIQDNFTKYTETAGIVSLREAICQKFKRDNNLDYGVENILVSPGAKTSIMFALLTICDPRDEVMLPSPYWVSYTSQVQLADALPILIPTSESMAFKITPKQLEETILNCSNPKALILNSPNNPTGTVYTREELEEIAQVCLKHKIFIISDEIYEKLIYDGEEHVSIASIDPEIKENCLVINGVSKAYSMTGWRLGFAAGPKDVIALMSRMQGHITSCVNTIAQKAAIVALTEDDGSIENMRQEFEKRRDVLVDKLNSVRNINCVQPKGAFYAMPNVSYYLFNNNKDITSTVQLCEYWLENFHVALVPGQAFGAIQYVRFSYANSMDNIVEGLKRFEAGLKSLV